MAPPRRLAPAVGEWGATIALVAASGLAFVQVARTGAPPAAVVAALLGLAYLVARTWRDGGEFALDALPSRPLGPDAYPTVRRAIAALCEAAGQAQPRVELADMDVPGAIVGRDDGVGVIAFDPRLPSIMSPAALRAVMAHELGHLRVGTLSMALRQYAPRVVGFGACWTVLLAGSGPTPATLGTLAFVVLAVSSGPAPTAARYALGLFVEPLATVVDRYATRMTEYRADDLASDLTSPGDLSEGLCRIAAIATGDNDEDVAGPVPFNVDRPWWFGLWATHPSVEDRIAHVGCPFPDWVVPHLPGAASANDRT